MKRAIIALGVSAVAIAGCSSVERPVQATTPAPLSPSIYQEKLQSADSAAAAAFDRFATAGSPEDAHAELKQASGAVLEAARLLDVNPPAEMLAAHRDLVAGLRQLATDLSQLSNQAASMKLCAAPSILALASNAPGVNSLRTVREALGSGRLGTSYQWGEFLPAPTQLPERRLANGQLVDSLRRIGNGQLKVNNGTEHDAVVKLVQGGKPIVSVYVGKESSATVENIDDGNYELFYTSGIDWDNQLKTFTRSCQFIRFEAPAEFTTVPIEGGFRYTVQSVVLQPRIGGNARVPAQSFPR
ncbi:MAG: hypothetical protein M3460_13035 [Actinomycetota bacterium]|nr:hypothetical protein [Actinomycetota bacterium]